MGEVKKRDESGKFAKTELTQNRDRCIEKAGGMEVLYGYVEAGLSMPQIADRIGLDAPTEKQRWTIRHALRSDSDRYEEAKKASAEAHMEKAGEVYGDEAPDSTADAKWRNDLSGWHRWMAENRGGFNKDGTTVNVTFGELYLDTLRRKGHMNPDNRSRPIEEEPVEAEYEIEGESKLEDGKRAQDDYPSAVK